MPSFNIHTPRLILAIGALAATLSFTDAGAAPLTAQQDEAFSAPPVSDQVLGESRGGSYTPVTINNSELDATSTGNLVVGGTTGTNFLGDNAINSQGLVNVIQNTGNNVVIQSSTIVTLTINK